MIPNPAKPTKPKISNPAKPIVQYSLIDIINNYYLYACTPITICIL